MSTTLSKGSASTTVQCAFTRMIDDEIDADTQLDNVYPEISESVTHDTTKMSAIYEYLLGSEAVSYSEAKDLGSSTVSEDPAEAYAYNSRTITTLDNFLDFYGMTESNPVTVNGETTYTTWVGNTLFTERQDSTLRSTLQEISTELLENQIYSA